MKVESTEHTLTVSIDVQVDDSNDTSEITEQEWQAVTSRIADVLQDAGVTQATVAVSIRD